MGLVSNAAFSGDFLVAVAELRTPLAENYCRERYKWHKNRRNLLFSADNLLKKDFTAQNA